MRTLSGVILKHSGLSLVCLVLILLSSCSGGGFSVLSADLRSESVCSLSGGELKLEESALFFSVLPDGDGGTYSFSLEDPDGLVWEGSLHASEGGYVSEDLRLTDGLAFRSGDYSWRVIDESGQVVSGSVSYSADFSSLQPVSSAEGSGEYRDSFGNTVTVYGQP